MDDSTDDRSLDRIAPRVESQTPARQWLGLAATLLSVALASTGALLMVVSFSTRPPPGVPARGIDTLAWILPFLVFGPGGFACGVLGLKATKQRWLALVGVIASSVVTVIPMIMFFVATVAEGFLQCGIDLCYH